MDEYIKKLVNHEMGTYFKEYCSDPRQAMILLGGVALNSMGDFLGTTDAKYIEGNVLLEDIELSGTSPKINEILLNQCGGSVIKLKDLIQLNVEVKHTLKEWASFGEERILLADLGNGMYKSFDGMHRIVGHILSNKEYISSYILTNPGEFYPNNEPHVFYDIIKAYKRSKQTQQDKDNFIGALKLMISNTGNGREVLSNRFNIEHFPDIETQKLIRIALGE